VLIGRLKRTWLWVLLGLTLAPPSHADFDPSGRRKKKPTVTRKAPARPTAAKPSAKPAPSTAEEPKGAQSEALIARYTAIVLSQPGAPFPLQRLAQLYRERDGNVDQLVAEFEKRATTPGADQFNALVALAGIYVQAGQREKAEATYQRAIAEQPKNPVALLALAQLQADRGNKAEARQHF
jgi:tetratricopeptide (TPR) repeat protein